MVTKLFLIILLIFSAKIGSTQASFPSIAYQYKVDLRKVKNDQLKVELHFISGLNSVYEDTMTAMVFCLPKIVPGIYGAMDFGQNLTAIEAFDYLGISLEIQKLDENRWKISGLPEKLIYSINDGWEEFNTSKEGVFYSAASCFQENKVFVINHNTLFGYFENFADKTYSLEIYKPKGFYGATSLNRTKSSDTLDFYGARSYRVLVDNPIMYSLPDITKFNIGKTEITAAMYSTTGKKLSAEIASYIKPLLENQKEYLGGKLPIDYYTFILYHNENPDKNSSLGDGLEHSNSTLILMYMPLDLNMIKWNVYGIASHEFFHTLIPLGLHSSEIAQYDFNQPKLSKHIWMYEGTTEYFTLHMPIKQNLISVDEFLHNLETKIAEMKTFDNEFALTYLSENAMEYQSEYMNFYQKGAVLNACLDIELRSLSKGKYGVQNLIADLMQVYGENKPFEDSMLFDEIVRLSGFAELRAFFKNYVEGNDVLPFEAYFKKVGIDYHEKTGKLSLTKKPTNAQRALRKSWIGQ